MYREHTQTCGRGTHMTRAHTYTLTERARTHGTTHTHTHHTCTHLREGLPRQCGPHDELRGGRGARGERAAPRPHHHGDETEHDGEERQHNDDEAEDLARCIRGLRALPARLVVGVPALGTRAALWCVLVVAACTLTATRRGVEARTPLSRGQTTPDVGVVLALAPVPAQRPRSLAACSTHSDINRGVTDNNRDITTRHCQQQSARAHQGTRHPRDTSGTCRPSRMHTAARCQGSCRYSSRS
jgi:hypothetical protein